MTTTQFSAEPGTQAISMTHVFDAPRACVFKLYTDPNLLPQWWGPGKYTTVVDQMEVRPGGRWRYVQRAADGTEYAFHGVYHAIEAPERLVGTFEFEGMPGHVLLETATFTEQDGRTTLTTQSIFQSVADRDGMWGSGMAEGATESMDRLAALLANISN